ncbi:MULTISPECIES: response regulator transcription factor [Roseateles]|uniref:Response regulator transcription factor n=1 Tax=Pelomonas caseinilytica TaxID=2906763 RepID=A0ABS8X8W6_9BURK|nr:MULTISPECIES: response regulator transcription factor [unclassified Roseateles]MCE4537212.1 response regulator transcription factor [Pelomonas sp. P7]HEV6964124.1 response regulator transcription factor [Roseateles sp.]
MRLLLVEDDAMIGDSLREALRRQGFAADWVRDGQAADAVLSSGERFDAVLLDLGLPRLGGVEVLRALRARGDATPVIVLTARDALADKVAGLDAGADDYLVKPFELDELLARLRAVTRRHQGGRASPVLQVADLKLDPATREVTRAGRPVLLSAREFALLEALLERPGAIVSRAQLEDRLYGWGEELESNAISVYMHQLRKKLGADLLHTVRGLGYYAGPEKGGMA